MLKRILFVIAFQGTAMLFAQEGILKVHVTDSINGEAISFAVIRLESAGVQAGSGLADVDGKFTFKNLNPGRYTLITSFTGYPKTQTEDILIQNHKTTELDVQLSSLVKKEIVIVYYKKPLINPWGPTDVAFDRKQIEQSPLPPLDLVGASGVETKPGIQPSFHGARQNANVILIDGMRVIGSADLPRMGVEQVSLTMSGIPAEFGDGTGGFIQLETRSGLVNPKR